MSLALHRGMKRLAIALSLVFAAAACGGSSTPTGPDPAVGGSTSSSTGTIHGTVAGGATASTTSNTTGAGAGLTVTIEGTNISATVNGAGQFALSNVPAGTPIVLRFNGVGANAQINVGNVNPGQTMTITVVVAGDTAQLEEKTQGSDKEIEGRLESIQGSTLIVAGRTVTVGASTVIRHGDTTMTLSQLAVGQRVHVKGTVSGTGTTATTTATLIIVQNMNVSIPMNLEGSVSDLAGTASAFEFKIGSSVVKGTGSTEFKGGKSPSFTALANGGKVHVKGSMQNGFVQAETITLQGKS
jgi:hypothetical protein